jgi:Na+-transporting methylmalonyl-CoA/oxaloacetate decarboxylase gamma subunit
MNLATFYSASLPVAALSQHPAFSDSIIYQINGAFVVFAALGMIWALLEVTGYFFKRAGLAKPAGPVPVTGPEVAPVPAPPRIAPTESGNEISPELMAVISAAVAYTLGAEARVRSVVESPAAIQDWAREGRRQIHSARKVR